MGTAQARREVSLVRQAMAAHSWSAADAYSRAARGTDDGSSTMLRFEPRDWVSWARTHLALPEPRVD